MEYIYATLTLNELGEELNQENITAVLEAAGSDVIESRVKAIVAALEDVDIDDIGMEAGIPPAPTPETPDEPDETAEDADEVAESHIVDPEGAATDTTDVERDGMDESVASTAAAADDTRDASDASARTDSGTAGDEASGVVPPEAGSESGDDHVETDGGASRDESGAE